MSKKVIRFTADWCGPCKMYAPIFERVKALVEGWEFEAINVDEDADLAAKYQIRNIPATIIKINDEVVDRFIGVITEDQLVKKLNSFSEQPV
jgi:thiol-disulfide isomerase/thioredoxin